ncbi:hypothetical protein Pint_06992 [Pistacia integerrima]|uniref:Uncharacterized protein n=1 Tax=Pistacia integerrima TaxID=434235 RepID=A0ACC0XYN7_9ROSI|nr:hypothetical protein Pint_06992 [Pistacia integerrima]
MQEDLCCQLFGLPQDSIRAITPGLPLFLYSYTAVSFGGSNIEPTAWEDKKCRGESKISSPASKKTLLYFKEKCEKHFVLFCICVKKRVRSEKETILSISHILNVNLMFTIFRMESNLQFSCQ